MYRNKDGVIEDSFQAFLVENAKFTKGNEEYPIIRNDMISNDPPKKIMPFCKAINYKGDLSDVYIYFYSQDKTFERVRRNPKKYLSFFKRTGGIIGFDFSIHTDMPSIKQKAQINDNLSLTYYFAHNGIKCIPNIRYGSIDTRKEFYEAIPINKWVAIGTHGFYKYSWQKAEWFCLIGEIISNLKPVGIVVVGTLNKKTIEEYNSSCKIVLYESWMDENRRERNVKRAK